MKKIEGTLNDWDRLQEELADVMSRVWNQRAIVTNSPPGSREEKSAEIVLKSLDDEEDRLRKKIAGLSRFLHVELKERKT